MAGATIFQYWPPDAEHKREQPPEIPSSNASEFVGRRRRMGAAGRHAFVGRSASRPALPNLGRPQSPPFGPRRHPRRKMEALIRCADRLGIERLILSQGYSADQHPTPDQLREENDRVLRAVRRFPDRAYGSVYLSPSHLDASLKEFDRCVRDGPMIGIGELEIDKRCNAPELDPIVDRAVSMKAPILQHCWLK